MIEDIIRPQGRYHCLERAVAAVQFQQFFAPNW
jgi:hypothetical protein